jgi:hypothetical protein
MILSIKIFGLYQMTIVIARPRKRKRRIIDAVDFQARCHPFATKADSSAVQWTSTALYNFTKEEWRRNE